MRLSSDNVPLAASTVFLASLKYRSPELVHESGQRSPSALYSPGPESLSHDTSEMGSRAPTPTFSQRGDEAFPEAQYAGLDTFQAALLQQHATLNPPPQLAAMCPPRQPAVLESPPPLTYPEHAQPYPQQPPPQLQPAVLEYPPPLMYPREMPAGGYSLSPSDCGTSVPISCIIPFNSAPHYGGYNCNYQGTFGGLPSGNIAPAPHAGSNGHGTAWLEPPPWTAQLQAPTAPLTGGLASAHQVGPLPM